MLKELKCAAAPTECLLFCQRPLTRLLSHRFQSCHFFACSIGGNNIGDKGASALAAILKETKITALG